jgi:hypothetical protein
MGLAMVATYGLRPHEVFHLECLPDAEGWIQIGGAERTKTGFRPVMPAPLAWVERYGLRENLAAELPGSPSSTPTGPASTTSTWGANWAGRCA